jgi:hypothetical protein
VHNILFEADPELPPALTPAVSEGVDDSFDDSGSGVPALVPTDRIEVALAAAISAAAEARDMEKLGLALKLLRDHLKMRTTVG